MTAQGTETAYPFGYWEVAGKKYTNKLRAVLDAVQIGHWPHWNFREKDFSSVNWSIEPTEDLHTLYRQRAKKLREKYDWICLEYTGGSDSWYVLKSFVDAGCQVDMLYHKFIDLPGQEKSDFDSKNTHAEAKYQAYPEYQKFKELDPTLNLYIHHVKEDTIKAWKETPMSLLEQNAMMASSVHKFPHTRFEMPWFTPSSGKNAFICAMDKPNLFFENNKFYFYFNEHPVNARCVIERAQMNLPTDDVLFYWDTDNIKTIIKQAHIVMNWFKKNPHMLYLINNRKKREPNTYAEIVRRLVYPDYKNYWQAKKHGGSFFLTGVDDWFHEDQNSAHCVNWNKSMSESSDVLFNAVKNTSFKEYITQESKYWVPCDQWSKLYYLGDL